MDNNEQMAWVRQAVCVDEDPELFFPISEANAACLQQIEVAKAVCQTCPVIKKCLQYALDQKIDDGVWGGTTAAERRRIRLIARRAEIAVEE